MRTIGLLGGMSWPSTITYYRGINEGVNARLGGSHSARILIWSDDYALTERQQLAGEWTAAGDRLAGAAVALQEAGADLIGIACNTMHEVAPAVRSALRVPLVDLVEVNAARAAGLGVTRVGLLGTPITMRMAAYRERFAARSIDLTLPGEDDQEIVRRAIYDELCHGVVRPETGAAIHRVIGRMVADGAEGIVLACTEFNLVVDTAACGVPVLDTTLVHLEALVAAALDE
ncbi:amino acid racemase [Streptomyces sp. SL13]|uniref:Amino acid racemase n=1 Tax=Streptantibioticus silvisoli TaxID=2705255 RepID=A0AA90GYE2_9ACTN|nr:amino acid racemase [Streptantibioticus silvisoli]MDI5963963.1 amino acid racemase [Streptantibioticus silvisoli]MDI5970074.1 amino acid racemase [Streptantibioticus silvisoli]